MVKPLTEKKFVRPLNDYALPLLTQSIGLLLDICIFSNIVTESSYCFFYLIRKIFVNIICIYAV